MSVAVLQWQITWTLAFPTLVSALLFTNDHDPIWQLLAWRVLTRHYPRTHYGRASNIDGATCVDTAWRNSIGYGEISPPTVLAILHWIAQQQINLPDLRSPEPCCVVDLGSGNGNVLLAASLARQVSQAIGLEILPHLHDQAMDNVDHWKLLDKSVTEVEWRFACADFTVDRDWIRRADLVFIHATVFEDSLLQTLNSLCQECRPGTVFCLISRPLKEEGGIRSVAEFQLDMSWGIATVFLQQKTADSAAATADG